MFTNLEDI